MKNSAIFAFAMKIVLVCISVLAISLSEQGRTTNRFYSLANGGFHHHGGFLGGYFNFYRGSAYNPADSFSNKYKTRNTDKDHQHQDQHSYSIQEPVFEESDPRLLLEIPPNTNSSSFYLQKLLDAQVSYNDSFNRK